MRPTAALLDGFLAASERRALRIAQLATRDLDEAHDLVQDAMIQLARHYADRDPSEWAPLFHRILDNGIRKWRLRHALRRRWFGLRLLAAPDETDDAEADPVVRLPAPASDHPDQALAKAQALAAVQQALQALPHRQRQAFLLRHWEGLSTEETAIAMGCSTGSVKTHLFRAVAALQPPLERAGLKP